MCITTKLRVLRLKYKISLMELAKQGGLSNQQISHMELGDIPRTKHKEQLAAAALSSRTQIKADKAEKRASIFRNKTS